MTKYVVVTGVSSGIGFATAVELAQHGYYVFGSVRHAADADKITTELGNERAPHFTPLLFDITDEAAVRTAAETVAATIGAQGLTGLVNNAGITVPGPLRDMPLTDFRQQLEINLVGTLAVTQAFLPLLGARRDAPSGPPGPSWPRLVC